MSDTPKTDAFLDLYDHHKPNYIAFECIGEFARGLERELDESTADAERFRWLIKNASLVTLKDEDRFPIFMFREDIDKEMGVKP